MCSFCGACVPGPIAPTRPRIMCLGEPIARDPRHAGGRGGKFGLGLARWISPSAIDLKLLGRFLGKTFGKNLLG